MSDVDAGVQRGPSAARPGPLPRRRHPGAAAAPVRRDPRVRQGRRAAPVRRPRPPPDRDRHARRAAEASGLVQRSRIHRRAQAPVHRARPGRPRHGAPRGPGRSQVSWDDAVQHARALVGWYESYTTAGDEQNTRERYIARFIETWRRRTGHRVVYSAANAHTAGVEEQVVSFPDEYPGPDVTRRRTAGGILRRVHGRRYRSIATVFDHGDVLTGWETGGPKVCAMPSPHESFIDRDLGTARIPDYLVDLRHGAPPPVRHRLDGPAKLRTVSAAYVPEKDAEYHHTVGSLSSAFDAILHIDQVTPTRLLNAPHP
ncbi:erythromycin esterase family protein [Actinomadura soli]|uniref:Erythromycin esterase family protein n=1 Tax=Actinomadura soli TaxID=2508997 RepID=A0A5C4JD62_9ACTN|nr:erythromycin esterase family protein [Actinomadura soli]